jgi:hypothetical protein
MSDTPIIQFIGTDFLRCPAYESHAHEAYAPKTDEHCAVIMLWVQGQTTESVT